LVLNNNESRPLLWLFFVCLSAWFIFSFFVVILFCFCFVLILLACLLFSGFFLFPAFY
jgi:hypothetical protein